MSKKEILVFQFLNSNIVYSCEVWFKNIKLSLLVSRTITIEFKQKEFDPEVSITKYFHAKSKLLHPHPSSPALLKILVGHLLSNLGSQEKKMENNNICF